MEQEITGILRILSLIKQVYQNGLNRPSPPYVKNVIPFGNGVTIAKTKIISFVLWFKQFAEQFVKCK
jgi:hypothetical protein